MMLEAHKKNIIKQETMTTMTSKFCGINNKLHAENISKSHLHYLFKYYSFYSCKYICEKASHKNHTSFF